MRRQLTKRRQPRRVKPVYEYRPEIFQLEDRRAPGDGLLGSLMTAAAIGAGYSVAGHNTDYETRVQLVSAFLDDQGRDANQTTAVESVLARSEHGAARMHAVGTAEPTVIFGPTGAWDEILVDPLIAADIFAMPARLKGARNNLGLLSNGRGAIDETSSVSSSNTLGMTPATARASSEGAPVAAPNAFIGPRSPAGSRDELPCTLETVPPTIPDEDCCETDGELVKTAKGVSGGNSPSKNYSASNFNYASGKAKVVSTDLSSSGFGSTWSRTRIWDNCYLIPVGGRGLSGNGMTASDQPFIFRHNNDDSLIAVVTTGSNVRYFQSGVGMFFIQDKLTIGTNEYTMTDTTGNRLVFHGFGGGLPEGLLKKFIDPYGNVTNVTYNAEGKMSVVQRSFGVGSLEQFVYSYDAISGKVASVLLQRKLFPGDWVPIRQVVYEYYEDGDEFGDEGNLKLVTIKDGAGNNLDKKHYRYYTQAEIDDNPSTPGFKDALKYVFNAESFARLDAVYDDPLEVSNNDAKDFADDYFEYFITGDPSLQWKAARVTLHRKQAAGASSGGGLGTHTYVYEKSAFSEYTDYNTWLYKTTETLLDGNQNVVISNKIGQPMVKVFKSGGQDWITFYEYDSAGREILRANPSAVSSYDTTGTKKNPIDLTTDGDRGRLKSNSGLIETTTYATSTTADESSVGDVEGYVKENAIKQGKNGTSVKQKAFRYYKHTASTQNGGGVVYPVGEETRYRNDNSNGAQVTLTDQLTWHSNLAGTTTQMKSARVQQPQVTAGQNGPGVSDEQTTHYDIEGRAIWQLDGATDDPDRVIRYWRYDHGTGAVTRTIEDVNHTLTSDFTGLPSGWTTPSGSNHGLHLKTDQVVDGLGRTTKLTEPDLNVTHTVYKDSNHEVRTYPGWQTATNTTTGPIAVSREDRGHGPDSYTETYTMAVAPTVDNGVPNGNETPGNLLSLDRTLTSRGGQVKETRRYFNMAGISYSTNLVLGAAGTNYYVTSYAYDSRGRLYQTTSPTGTITETEFDGLSRPIAQSTGTSSGMVTTSTNVYDGAIGTPGTPGVGDGNLTQTTLNVDASTTRVIQHFYDWRNRLVASKNGATGNPSDDTVQRSVTYIEYDNLDQATAAESYDGDTVTIVDTTPADGVPDKPAQGRRRARVLTHYDEQGRVYRTETYNVSQTNGDLLPTGSPTTLKSNTWHDRRGQVIKTSEPGGSVYKTQYDGPGRAIKTFITDGGGDSDGTDDYNDAWHVTGDIVLSQTEMTYDANSNPTLVKTKDRFHDETATGELQDPATAPKARVSYGANYYDDADRLTDTVNAGTNGGAAYTPPPTPPARSDRFLVTSYGYKADEVQSVSFTTPPTSGTFKLTFCNAPGDCQTTGTIQWNAVASDVQTALNGLGYLTGNVFVTGPRFGPFSVRFVNGKGERNVLEMTADSTLLTGGPAVVTTPSEGGDTGRQQAMTDPRGLIAKSDYDLAGRVLRTVENFMNFVPSATDDRTTEFAYNGANQLTFLTAVLPEVVAGTSHYQKTEYVYDVTTTGSDLYSKELLSTIKYPNKSTGDPSATDQETFRYNRQGEVKSMTQRRGTVHDYEFDALGRQVRDKVSTLGGADSAVQRLETQYDTAGRPYRFTSCSLATSCNPDTGTNVVNQVERAFNGLGQLITEYQSHAGVVNPTTTLKVRYAYSEMPSGANHSRLTSIRYPETTSGPTGRLLEFVYSGLDDTISRLSSQKMNSVTLEAYSYLGLSTIAVRAHPESGVDLNYLQQTGDPAIQPSSHDPGDKYTGLDRFGRVRDQRWFKATDVANPKDRFVYGYDRNGNRLYRDNLANATGNFDELYHVNGETAGYDGLNQLTEFRRGPLSDSGTDSVPDTVASASRWQNWTLDGMGNWDAVTSDIGTDDRNHDQQNQITSISGQTTPGYDANGNTTGDETGKTLTYDAWNRLVAVSGSPGVTHGYDALGRRIKETRSTTTDLYYSDGWQVLETLNSSVKTQFVWNPGYVDSMVLRDRDTDANGSFDQRLYVQQDANFNVTSIADTTGAVVERYAYDPYGKVTYLDASWGTQSASAYGMVYLHQGGRLDATSGLYHFRNREQSSVLGRWMQADPVGYQEGQLNLYVHLEGAPVTNVDPTGLTTKWVGPWIGTPNVKARLIIYFGPWQCRKVWVDDCKKKCENRKAKFLGCVWVSDSNLQVTGGITGSGGTFDAQIHCCCDCPKLSKEELEKRRKEWEDEREKYRKWFEERFGKFPTDEDGKWPVHHLDPLLRGGDPKNPLNLIPLPPDVHKKVHKAYNECYDGKGDWDKPGPHFPYRP